MKQIQQNTILSSTPGFLNNALGPGAASTQLTGTIMNNIQNGGGPANLNKPSPPKPWIPQQYCMWPNSPRLDEFNLKEGLGQISMQPVIDSLNQFKQTCIASIKAQLHAMGPDGSKDAKLAAGITDVINQVYQAAKCFTQIVQNLNNLISTYIAVIDYVIINIVNKISQLEHQILALQKMLNPQYLEAELVAAIGQDLLNALYISDILHLIGAVNNCLNAIGKLQQSVTSLSKSPERALMHFESDLTMLKGMVTNFNYFTQLLGIAQSNRIQAAAMSVQDDYLDNFDYAPSDSGDYSWSITNSSGLVDYNIIDTNNILSKLTSACGAYINMEQSTPILIDSRTVSGTIVVDSDGDGIISGGLGPGTLSGKITFGLMFELAINDGATIIQAFLQPTPLPSPIPSQAPGNILNSVIGNIVIDQSASFNYSKTTDNGNGTWNLYFVNPNNVPNISIGAWYCNGTIVDDQTYAFGNTTLSYSSWMTATNGYFGAYDVLNITPPTANRVDSSPIYFNGTPYNEDVLPGYGWDFQIVGPTGQKYYFPIVFEVTNVTPSYVTIKILRSSDLVASQFITGADATYIIANTQNSNGMPQNQPPQNHNRDIGDQIIFTMNQYPLSNSTNYPHAGQKIPCKN